MSQRRQRPELRGDVRGIARPDRHRQVAAQPRSIDARQSAARDRRVPWLRRGERMKPAPPPRRSLLGRLRGRALADRRGALPGASAARASTARRHTRSSLRPSRPSRAAQGAHAPRRPSPLDAPVAERSATAPGSLWLVQPRACSDASRRRRIAGAAAAVLIVIALTSTTAAASRRASIRPPEAPPARRPRPRPPARTRRTPRARTRSQRSPGHRRRRASPTQVWRPTPASPALRPGPGGTVARRETRPAAVVYAQLSLPVRRRSALPVRPASAAGRARGAALRVGRSRRYRPEPRRGRAPAPRTETRWRRRRHGSRAASRVDAGPGPLLTFTCRRTSPPGPNSMSPPSSRPDYEGPGSPPLAAQLTLTTR